MSREKFDKIERQGHDGRMTESHDSRPSPDHDFFWRYFGVEPEFENEAQAPTVNVERLRRYYRQELAEAECEEVQHLVARFRSWYDAFGEVVRSRGAEN